MISITPEESADLTQTEQRQIERWIGEYRGWAELQAEHKRNQQIRIAMDQLENEDDGNEPYLL